MSDNFFNFESDFKINDNLFNAGFEEQPAEKPKEEQGSKKSEDNSGSKKNVTEYITDAKGNKLLKSFKFFLEDNVISEGTNTYNGDIKVSTEYKVTYGNGKTKVGKSIFNKIGNKTDEEYTYEYDNGCVRKDKIKYKNNDNYTSEYSVEYPNNDFEQGKIKVENGFPVIQEYTLQRANGDKQTGKVSYYDDGTKESHKYTLKKANGEVIKRNFDY